MQTLISPDKLHHIAEGFGLRNAFIEPLGGGLIHHTYRAVANGQAIVLQQINTQVFIDPNALVQNYLVVYDHLRQQGGIQVPAPIPATNGSWLLRDEDGNSWRATSYIANSFSPDATDNAKAAFTTASCFAQFSKALSGIDKSRLQVVLADFHDLTFRYHQFEDTVARVYGLRLMRATHVIAELRERKYLVDFYASIKNNPEYPVRLLHHDCKIGNILFDKDTREIICPIDLDTIMPGKYFSDVGDMIRTMSCTVDENSREWELIDVRPEFYNAIVDGYLHGMGAEFTAAEIENIHKSGLLMTYMQTIRFLTDFLNGDVYYRTTYPEQNLNRALNQLILLEKLEQYLSQMGTRME
jgi:aminoglycoside phosphotransferase (APT) family kinase protein